MIITFIHSAHTSDHYRAQIRCRNFAEAIQRTGYHTAYLVDLESFIMNTPKAQEACQKADLLVIHRHLYGAVIRTLLFWKARGKKIAVDFDEASHLLTPEMPGHLFWKKGVVKDDRQYQNVFAENPVQPVPYEQFCWGLRSVDAAIVPSLRLADDWSGTVRTFYLPDFINTDQYMIQRCTQEGMNIIGVSGCSGHIQQLQHSGLLAALENITLQRKNVVIQFYEYERGFVESTCIPPNQWTVVDEVQAYQWPTALSNLDVGVVCAEGKFGARSSKIRVIEYAVMKIPWLASNLLPYREMEHFGWLVPNSAEHWTHAILEVIDHLDAYQTEANREPYLYGISQDVFENVNKIISVYETVLNL